MKKTNITCALGFHQYKWDWRNLCHRCMNCGETKNDLFMKIRNVVLFLACFLSVLAIGLALISYRANKMERFEQANNCRYDYNELCYTQEQKPWLFND